MRMGYLPEKKTVSQFDLKGRFARQYLSFAGKSSKDFLLYLSGPGVYDSPAADVESTSVPGRNGDIISENARAGRRRYQNVDIKYEAFFFNGLPAKTAAVKSWLLSPVGYQKLQDTYDPDFFRMAVCTEAMEFDVTAQKAAKMDLVFNCKPQRWSVEGQRTVRLESRSNLMNPFAFPAQPIFKVYGDSGGVLYVGDESITIHSIKDYVLLNCETHNAYNTPYCISAAGKAGYGLYAFYDENGNRIGGENNTGNTDRKIENKVVTSPARAASIRIACINGMQSCGIQPMTRGYFIGMKPKWFGRTWVCLGDSLTESNSRTTKHYFDYIAEKTGIKTVNLGVSGTGYMRRKDINRAFYQRVSDIPEDADVITIFGSGNDLSSDQTLGTVTDTGTDTICGCINATIDAIYERIPLARLGIVTPTPWVGSMPSKTTCGMAKYSEAIVEICKRRSIPCLDLYHESNLRPDDENFRKLAFSKDGGNGVHPDEKGHEIIAASFQSLLERLIL